MPVIGGIPVMTGQAASHVYFGLNPMWVSTCVLAITYATIMSEKVNRSIVALVGATVMILIGVLDQDEAIKGIDWNTIGLLTGMMILVSISRRSGMFQYIAIWSAKAAKAHPAGILFILQITTAVLSAFLDNVTTVLLIVPVTLAICKTLHVPAYPYLFAEIFASNIGSEHIVGLAGSGAKDGVAMAHYELHAWCLLVLAWVFVPFYARSLVFTMPVPKTRSHRRLTVTRAVSGFSGLMSHCARARRLAG